MIYIRISLKNWICRTATIRIVTDAEIADSGIAESKSQGFQARDTFSK